MLIINGFIDVANHIFISSKEEFILKGVIVAVIGFLSYFNIQIENLRQCSKF